MTERKIYVPERYKAVVDGDTITVDEFKRGENVWTTTWEYGELCAATYNGVEVDTDQVAATFPMRVLEAMGNAARNHGLYTD